MGAYEISRSTTIAADPARVHGLINDFHQWPAWSPWEDLDADLERTYSGPDAGPGSRYAWRGNRKAGEGSMEITGSTPERIDIALVFLKPWKAKNRVWFVLGNLPGDDTSITWSMSGENRGLAGVFAKVFNMDKLLGRDFEKGLTRLKAAAEA